MSSFVHKHGNYSSTRLPVNGLFPKRRTPHYDLKAVHTGNLILSIYSELLLKWSCWDQSFYVLIEGVIRSNKC